jgi:hypothetical protein
MAPDPGALPQTPPHFAPPPWRGGGVAENGREEWMECFESTRVRAGELGPVLGSLPGER